MPSFAAGKSQDERPATRDPGLLEVLRIQRRGAERSMVEMLREEEKKGRSVRSSDAKDCTPTQRIAG